MRSFFKAEKQKEEHNMSTREKLNKKIARQIREEIAEAIHASAERIAKLRRRSSQKQQTVNLQSASGK